MDNVLAGIPGFEDAVATPLSGGITNRNFRIERDGEAFVLRLGGTGTDLLGIDRAAEHHATRIAADLGLGAPVVFSDAAADVLLTRFVPGRTLDAETASRVDMLERIGRSIRRLHDGPAFQGTFSAFEVVRTYHERSSLRGVVFPPETTEALSLMDAIERSLEAAVPRPCHNDLLAANFIDDGERITIIDWEYAAMGDPFFDLGNFAVNQSLDAAACRLLLQAYAGEVPPQDLARLHLMRLASDMREAFWGFLQSGVSTLDFDFLAYAAKHLHRFLERASAASFHEWLADLRV